MRKKNKTPINTAMTYGDFYKKNISLKKIKIPILKQIAKNLPNIPCENDNGERTICTKIPETIHVYLTGRY